MTHVLITKQFEARLVDKIQAVSPEIKLEQFSLVDREWPADRATEAEVLYAVAGLPLPERAPNLRWIQVHWAGVDHLHDQPIWEAGVQITTASGVHAPNLGQYVMAQILTWSNRVPQWLAYQRQKEWPKDRYRKLLPVELSGRTLGILGYGSIGREVARLAKSFGMHVLATKRNARSLTDDGYAVPGTGDPNGAAADRIYPSEATRSMVAECDFLVITLPLTEKTHHLIDEAMLREMKPSCFLINIGRGALIREADLIKGLEKGWIGGAGLDVFENEPLPESSPLWGLENVIISPHISGLTPNYDQRAADLFAENLRRYLAKEPLLNLVDRDLGY